MVKKYLFIFFLISFCTPIFSIAAPSITSITGDVHRGQTITISGTDFGNHLDYGAGKEYLCRLFDNFESGELNTSSGYWDSGDQTGVVIDNSSSANRGGSNFMARQVRGSGKYSSLIHTGDSSQDIVYMYTWRKFTGYATLTATNNKSWRIYPNTGLDNWVMSIIGPDNWISGNYRWAIERVTNDYSANFGAEFYEQWHCYEILVDKPNNIVKVWMDGDLKSSNSPSGWGGWNPYRIVFDAFSHESDEPYTYTDDCYISHTAARVMLGNNSNFANADHREIQIPIAWSNGEIDVRLNQGSFRDGENAYLFVVKADGTVNSTGYPVVFGGNNLADPMMPTNTPEISNISGTMLRGNQVMISGSNFGNHPDFSPSHPYLARIFDDFESGQLNNASGSWDAGNQSGIYLEGDGNINRANSSYSVRQVRGSGKYSSLGHIGDPSQRVLYMYSWRRFDPFSSITVTNSKIFRVWSSVSNDNNWVMSILNNDWRNGLFGWDIEGEWQTGQEVKYGSFGPEFIGNWHCYEVLIDQNNNSVKVWIDGVEKSSDSPYSWGVFNPYGIFYDAFSHESDNPYTYTDDCYISHTQARVMIGNSSTYSNSSHREIQIPTSWSNNSITIIANQGAYKSGDRAYLYVIDSEGNVTDSFPISFGDSAPNNPTLDRVKNVRIIN